MVATPITQLRPQVSQEEGEGYGLEEFDRISALAPPEDGQGWGLPADFLLGTLGDGRLRVIAPITVNVTTENEDFIAEAVEFAEFGYGSTRSAAVRDLQRAITELFFSLTQDEERLGADLTATLGRMRRKIVARRIA